MSNLLWLVFVAGTILCWGAYGPSIHEGQKALGSPWKSFLCVGIAYFVIAVVVPLILLRGDLALKDKPRDSAPGVETAETSPGRRGLIFATTAGALGALGALFIIGALKNGGNPLYVMPLVFGCAPVVNVLVSMTLHPPKAAPSPWLYVGIVVVAGGAGLVLLFKPS